MVAAWARCGWPVLLAWLLPLAVWAQGVLPVPALSGRVIDQTGTLSAAQVAALGAKLAAFEAEAGAQIVVLMVGSTQPEDIAAYAQRVADQWKIGRREVGDGLLLVVAKSDRRVRIEVAKALEGAVPDLAARQIIDQHIRPAFRADDYAGGLDRAVDALMAQIRGEGLPPPASGPSSARDGPSIDDLALFFFLGVPFMGVLLSLLLGRRWGSWATYALSGWLAWDLTASLGLALAAVFGAWILIGVLGVGSSLQRQGPLPAGTWFGLGGGGGGGGGHDGGGFSSGGGGDFGGGGASGDW